MTIKHCIQLFFGVLLLVLCAQDAHARGRGGGARISVRYSSYRSYSYRSYNSYSYSSYRYSSGGSFRSSSYVMAPVILRRKGGYSGNKQLLFMAGSIYIAHKMRPKFYISGRGYNYYGDYDDFAVCSGNITGQNAVNATAIFTYFVCPSDVRNFYNYDDKYCCGKPDDQYCCDEEAFYVQYGSSAPAGSVALIAVASILSVLFLCGCCGLLVYCSLRNRMRRYNQPAAAAVPSDPSKLAYPMQPPPAGPGAYPVQAEPERQPLQSAGVGPGYPPMGPPAPYPMYPPADQQPMPMAQPPPYPGPV